ncbi:hypothetical protein LOC68_14560 [Blastopirellula sp. JC732]|uniref:Uncharacterized protein n=1 Tax=Blastopirellula sediminis TaxID=2894196 RepID=A0A9X1MNP2_9BACT|nr:hypothetical protein [Blastopirellula sediminis]MCC9607095.1 hypothetical protein [Blastopirellula sediminis]MCC9629612.1 hypothetical protein [Blastopirellula sediminis]
MNDADATHEAIGTVIGFAAGCVVVQLSDGSEVICRGVKRIHRIYGCFTPRIGQRFLIRYSRGPARLPLLIKVLDDDSAK